MRCLLLGQYSLTICYEQETSATRVLHKSTAKAEVARFAVTSAVVFVCLVVCVCVCCVYFLGCLLVCLLVCLLACLVGWLVG